MKINSDINGLIHNTEIPGQPEDPGDALKVGQEVEARVIEVNKSEKTIGLTLMPPGESPAENGTDKDSKTEEE